MEPQLREAAQSGEQSGDRVLLRRVFSVAVYDRPFDSVIAQCPSMK